MKIFRNITLQKLLSSFKIRSMPPLIQRNSWAKIPITQLIIAILGLCTSIWALQSYIAIISGAENIICDVEGILNCTKVIGSDYGKISGIPLGYFGISYWTIVLIASVMPLFTAVDERWIARWRLSIGSAGLITALIFAFITFVIIKSICLICEIIQLVCIIYFILTIIAYRKTGNQSLTSNLHSFKRLFMASIIAGIIPLIIGLIFTPTASLETGHTTGLSIINSMERDVTYKQTGSHSLGRRDAPVVITVFTDFECSWCRRFHILIQSEIKKAGMKNVRLIFRNYPIKKHKHSRDIALAARCAGREGYFWEFADWAFSKSESAGKNPQEKEVYFSRKGLKDQAVELGVNENQFIKCYDNKEELEKIIQDKHEAKRLGLKGTPHILLNGKPCRKGWNEPGKLVRQIRIAAGLEEPGSVEDDEAKEEFFFSFFYSFIDKFRSDFKKSHIDINKDGKPDHYSYTLRKLGIMIMMLVDTDMDGKINDINWVKGNKKEPHKAMLLYSENIKKGNKSRTWFGPGNIKMVGQDDLDKNGDLETVVYYNSFAKPKILQRIIARFETDSNGNGKPDIWTYPDMRMEIDTDNNGKPDIYTINREEIINNYRLMIKGMKKEKMTGQALLNKNSWALHPDIIKEERYRAIITHSLTGVQP